MSGTESVDSTWELSGEEGGALAGRWWKWALSAPDDRCPVQDTTGEHAAWKQPGDLWFLAGTYGGRVVRRCAVPADRRLFFPVLNMQHTRSYSRVPRSMAVAEADASLNGVPLPLREFTAAFRTGLVQRYAWGVWGGVAPLTPGAYVLEIRARATNGFQVDTTYHLESKVF
ncbi:hypothetical protein [Streptomyces fulvorobeus]|uniref:Uncharacterized protein n=1 Tax=Streptomyces fulvorobeus TaxID=284028 RepID=A0A7J0C160_9ACTN|nr:hypothetical protein [Streptomyces fulvorobeus]NYE39997.1 hypothetical protein [Streptomyces fulvorobeus]GFM96255.1 hypothetical protein Sfulv_10660 [Streptomyces fulvorobeus]